MKKILLLLVTMLSLISCGTLHIESDEAVIATKILYRAPFNGYYTRLEQTLTDIGVPEGIKYVTVYVGFDVWENGGAYDSFDIYIANDMLETKAPSYGVNSIHRTDDIKTGTYYMSFIPTLRIEVDDDVSTTLLTLTINQCFWHDGATWNNKKGVASYGITKVIGHY